MKIEKITASYGMTINIGNYESIRIDAGATADPQGEALEYVYERVWKTIKEELDPKIKAIREKYKVALK